MTATPGSAPTIGAFFGPDEEKTATPPPAAFEPQPAPPPKPSPQRAGDAEAGNRTEDNEFVVVSAIGRGATMADNLRAKFERAVALATKNREFYVRFGVDLSDREVAVLRRAARDRNWSSIGHLLEPSAAAPRIAVIQVRNEPTATSTPELPAATSTVYVQATAKPFPAPKRKPVAKKQTAKKKKKDATMAPELAPGDQGSGPEVSAS